MIILKMLRLILWPLVQMEQVNGTLDFDNIQQPLLQPRHHFGQLTIFLVLEDYEMMY